MATKKQTKDNPEVISKKIQKAYQVALNAVRFEDRQKAAKKYRSYLETDGYSLITPAGCVESPENLAPQYTTWSLNDVLVAASATKYAEKALELKGQAATTNKAFGEALKEVRDRLGKLKGCKGRFGEWLGEHDIASRTAYYAMDFAEGKVRNPTKRAQEAAAEKAAARRKEKEEETVLAYFETKTPEETLRQFQNIWKKLFPKAGPLLSVNPAIGWVGKAIPSDSRSAKVITRCFRLLPNRSSFQTAIASNFRRLASAIKRLSSGLDSLAPLTPLSTYSPAIFHPRRILYSRSSFS